MPTRPLPAVVFVAVISFWPFNAAADDSLGVEVGWCEMKGDHDEPADPLEDPLEKYATSMRRPRRAA